MQGSSDSAIPSHYAESVAMSNGNSISADSMTRVLAKPRASNSNGADRLFRWTVTAAGIFVLVSLSAAALSMLWGGR